jgi:hypothetical protein
MQTGLQTPSHFMRSALQVHKLLKASKRSSHLLRRAERSGQLTHDLRSLLPSPLASYCQVGDLTGHTLTIIATSPVWAAKLRYLQPTLLKAFRSISSLSQATDINIKISKLSQPLPNPTRSRKVHMSSQSAEHIRQMADTIEDPALRESLLRLSRHAKDKDDS